MQQITLTTKDNHILKGYQFEPLGDPVAKVIIVPAMGTSQSYYHPLARWLTEQGYLVTTFDLRGMGESKTTHLKHYQNNILDWAKYDCQSALSHVVDQQQELPIIWLGHSLGGQIFPLVPGIEKVNKVITIASGTGYWKHNAPPLRKKVWWFWFIFVPILLPLFGYFPGKKLGMVGDLPKGVMAQWRKWCMHPEYCVGTESGDVRKDFSRFKAPITCLAITDDEMLSMSNIEGLFSLFGSNAKQLKALTPSDQGVKRIGHLGFFREEFRTNLWPNTLLPELNLS